MLTRRLAASACALCLAVPTAASAMPGRRVHVGHVHHTAAVVATGDTKNDLHVQSLRAGHRRRHQGPPAPRDRARAGDHQAP